jgi:hypothetical protein
MDFSASRIAFFAAAAQPSGLLPMISITVYALIGSSWVIVRRERPHRVVARLHKT